MSILPTPADGALPLAHKVTSSSTPVKKSLQGSQHFASQSKHDAELLKVDMAEELAGQWVGPMPVKEFIDAFLPLDAQILAKMPKFKSNYFNSLAQQDHENLMYDPFIKAVESSSALPHFKLVNTSSHPDEDAVTGMKNKPDVSCYRQGVDLGTKHTNFEEMELILEFKPHKYPADPFDDHGKAKEGVSFRFEAKSTKEDVHNAREKCREQLACYTRVWTARQHRNHCFVLWLGDPNARIIRMDHSGGIVSAKFNYRTQGNILLEFFWRFSQSTRQAQGHDTTVSKASLDEAILAKGLLMSANFTPASDRSVFKIQVPNAQDKTKTSSFLIWGPLADPRSATGRATRGYPAVDLEANNGEGSIVFLKDSWRSCEVEGMEKESAILHDLNKKGCRNVPELICGDDLDGQFTITKSYVEESWNIGGAPENIVQRVHTRFVQKQVGYHLEGFKSSWEFLQAVYDAALAHKDAYKKCGILHRDISAGNILMRKDGCGGGFLNDWDLAKRIHKDVVARQPFRSGTWQFMSVALLEVPDKINTLQDDLESFFWVVLYHALRYMAHSLDRLDKLRDVMIIIFDEEHGVAGEIARGGNGKRTLCLSRMPLGPDFTMHKNIPLNNFIDDMLTGLKQWYRQVDDHVEVVRVAQRRHNISREEAMARYPFDDRNLVMRNHDALISAFEDVLALETWPKNDVASDHYGKQRGRTLEEEKKPENKNATSTPGSVPDVTRPTKKIKTSKKLDDDAPYRPSQICSIAPPVFSSRETRPNEKPSGAYTEQDGSGSESE